MRWNTLRILKEFERSGTIPILLALNKLKKGKFADTYYKTIRMGFRLGSGAVSRRLDQLCDLGWVQKTENTGRRNRVFALTERGVNLAAVINEFVKNLEKPNSSKNQTKN